MPKVIHFIEKQDLNNTVVIIINQFEYVKQKFKVIIIWSKQVQLEG